MHVPVVYLLLFLWDLYKGVINKRISFVLHHTQTCTVERSLASLKNACQFKTTEEKKILLSRRSHVSF